MLCSLQYHLVNPATCNLSLGEHVRERTGVTSFALTSCMALLFFCYIRRCLVSVGVCVPFTFFPEGLVVKKETLQIMPFSGNVHPKLHRCKTRYTVYWIYVVKTGDYSLGGGGNIVCDFLVSLVRSAQHPLSLLLL